jgi:endoglucanase
MKRRELLEFAGLSAVALAVGEQVWAQSKGGLPTGGAAFNQVGYLPGGQKLASVLVRDAADLAFSVQSVRTEKAVLQGTLGAPMLDASSGDRLAQADFSALATPGEYRLWAQGKRSETFLVGKDVYRLALRTVVRAFYGQRCGCAVDLGGGYSHPACHLVGAFHKSSGREGAMPNHGGWHDAGDYGRYVVNSGISTGTLLWAWELYPEALKRLSLGIPESGGKLPDYLAEIRWNLEWMLELQDEDGGVWHKQTSEQFCGFIMPEKDTLTSYVIGTGSAPYKSTCATADFAAVMAIAARCYGPYDDGFAARCLAAAQKAWTWAQAHPDVLFQNPPGVSTGGYGDAHCHDEMLWASAELWRTTGDAEYEQAFLVQAEELTPELAIAVPGWGSLAPMAYWTYFMADRKGSRLATSGLAGKIKPEEMKARIRQQTAMAAEVLVGRRQLSGYGHTLAIADFGWGSNGVAANQALLLLVAHRFEADSAKKQELLEAALGNLHYLLGRNCFGVSWVTQVGTNPFQKPHHRPSAADGIAAPWPGLLSGGPNAKPADSVARSLPLGAPMRMWVDDERAYSMNEIAINWNAPLVFLLAAANALVA